MFSTRGHINIDQDISLANIMSLVTNYDMFKYYIPSFKKVNVQFCSELREDKRPSCVIAKMPSGMLIYKDFSTGDKYTSVRYVQDKYGISYDKALKMIASDFKLRHKNNLETLLTRKKVITEKLNQIPSSNYDIKISSIPYTRNGLMYWQEFGISALTLEKFGVRQISHFNIESVQYPIGNDIAFAYCFGDYKYKLLRPKQDRARKWRSNATPDIVQGKRQLAPKGELLIVTKSLKDVMVLHELGYHSIAPQSENTELPEKAIPWLKDRWDNIVIYYDNDEAGIRAAKRYSEKWGVSYVHNDMDKPKDISDYYKKYGKASAIKLLQALFTT